MSAAVEAARAALLEVKRPDLAARVRPNRLGWPLLDDGADVLGTNAHPLVVRAFLIGHHAGGHQGAVEHTEEDETYGRLSIWCELCSNGDQGEAL